ncbi:hypothetical protein C8039_07155 [Halogeometricum sp. wsp3]|nr:hypothetical protein C8039_07155 [Halogeometricum sp. wsp3]
MRGRGRVPRSARSASPRTPTCGSGARTQARRPKPLRPGQPAACRDDEALPRVVRSGQSLR